MSPGERRPGRHVDAAVRRLVADVPIDPGLDGRDAACQRICRAAVTSLGVTWCALHLATKGGDWGVAAAADDASRRLAEVAFMTGEGPSLDAFRLRRPVLVGALDRASYRWPGFTSVATAAGVRSTFSFPLQIGGVRLGTLDLYGDEPRPLAADDMSLALAFSVLATRTLLGDRAPGGPWTPLLEDRDEIHQAQGMVMVDLGVGLAEAMVRMRAHAFARGVSLVELAREIVAGRALPPADAEEV